MSRGPFAKVYRSLWNGTLGAKWEGWALLVYMLAHCDADGRIDETPEAIARKSGLPLDVVERGISILEAPDQHSRSAADKGRRIARLDDHRDWGWQIVNFEHYRSSEDPRGAVVRKRRQRHGESREVTASHGMSREAEAEADADRDQPLLPAGAERSPDGAAPPALPLGLTIPEGDASVFMTLPTNRQGAAVAVHEGQVREWAALFPAVDVRQELREMRAWLLANPRQRKTTRGMVAFVTRWLADEQDKAARGSQRARGHRSGVDERYRRENLGTRGAGNG